MDIIDEPDTSNVKKCYSCGKMFKTPTDLMRHKNRKTPCLIRDVKPEQINNPLRCMFCNKIFSNNSHLVRHLKICKIKNGGMDILVDKVHYEQKIRDLEAQQALSLQREKEKDQLLQQLKDRFDKLEMMVEKPVHQVINNTINNGVIVNICHYTNPCIDGLTVTATEIASVAKLSKLLLQKIYFNPLQPQNHCIYLKNKKDKSLIIHDAGAWRPVAGENITEVFNRLNDTVVLRGGDILNGNLGPYQGVDADFTKLPGGIASMIRDFNHHADLLTTDDAYEVFLGGRDIVLDTIKAAGCKLI